MEKNKSSLISESFQAMPIKFAVEIVRLKVYMIVASPMNLTFTQGHNRVRLKLDKFEYLTCSLIVLYRTL